MKLDFIEYKFLLPPLAAIIGLGVARKHTTTTPRKDLKIRKDFFRELGNVAKSGALSIAQRNKTLEQFLITTLIIAHTE